MAASFLRFNGNRSFLSVSTSRPHRRPLPSFRPMKVTMFSNQSYWTSIDADVEAHLKCAITVRPPLAVFEPMHHLVFTSPKTTAPALCVASCELVGGVRDQALPAASAIHLMHAATFTHEHLPLSDRPSPPAQHAFGPNIELLTGDGILPLAYELLARSNDQTGDKSEQVLRVIVEIARTMGSQGMIDGLYLQTACDGSGGGDETCDAGWISRVCEKKEGGLHACGAACGAILGGGSEEQIEKLRRYGLYVGMIQGMLYGVGRGEKGMLQAAEELRCLALQELKDFKEEEKVQAISSLVENSLCISV